MEFSAQQIAHFLHGTVEGDPEVKVSSFSKIEEGKPGTLTFLANLKYAHHLYDTEASIVLVNNDFKPEQPVRATLVRVENAYASLAMLLNLVERSKKQRKGIDPSAFIAASATVGDDCYVGNLAYIGEGARIGKNCMIYPFAYIGDNVTVGDHTICYPHVTIYENCAVGERCILHAGCVIGADGFGFAPEGETYKKITGQRHHRGRRGDRRQYDHRPRGHGFHRHPQGRETGQPRANRAQRGGGREHGDGGASRHRRLRENRQALHVRRASGPGGPYPRDRPRRLRRASGRHQRREGTGHPLGGTGHQREELHALQRDIQPPSGHLPHDRADATGDRTIKKRIT